MQRAHGPGRDAAVRAPERRAIISAVRDVILKHLPPGYREAPAFGMIGYAIPLERYPDTYNGQPLCYAGLVAQKNHNALYLMHAYQDAASAARLASAFERVGKKELAIQELELYLKAVPGAANAVEIQERIRKLKQP